MMLNKYDIDLDSVSRATFYANEKYKDIKKMVENFEADYHKKTRLESFICKVCFYMGSTIAGAAMCKRPCGMCDFVLHSGSTNCNILCKDCSRKHKLCSHCGADINLKIRRKI